MLGVILKIGQYVTFAFSPSIPTKLWESSLLESLFHSGKLKNLEPGVSMTSRTH